LADHYWFAKYRKIFAFILLTKPVASKSTNKEVYSINYKKIHSNSSELFSVKPSRCILIPTHGPGIFIFACHSSVG
jgi:hypothetical protein